MSLRVVVGCVLSVLVGCDGSTETDGGSSDGGTRDSAVIVCERDLDCGDSFCEPMSCRPGDPAANAAGCVAIGSPCEAGETCDEPSDMCVAAECLADPDPDDDGHDSIACGGDDCDDEDANRYPGNPEVCDAAGHDEDCVSDTVGDTDNDADGFVSIACCNGTVCGDDCDDTLADVRPGVAELCNGRDDDCDGMTDEIGGALPLCPGGVCTAGSCRLNAWDHTFGGPGRESGAAIAMDEAANVYVAGFFEGTAGFDGGDLTAAISTTNQVVVSYGADGTHRWDHRIAGHFTEWVIALAVTADGSSILVASAFEDSLDLGDGAPFTGPGTHLFVAQFRATDGVVERRTIIRAGRFDGLLVAGTEVLVTGRSYAPIDFGGTMVDGTFLVTLDSSLAVLSAVSLPGIVEVRAISSRPSGGNVLAAVGFGTVDLGCAGSVGGPDRDTGVVAGFDTTGACEWIYAIDGAIDFWDVATHTDGSVYVVADHGGGVNFGGGSRPAGGIVFSLSADGAFRWDRALSSPAMATLRGIDTSTDGVLAAGYFLESLTIGGSTLAGSTHLDSVVVELSLTGAVRRFRTFVANNDNEAADVVVGRGGSTVVLGMWRGTITLGTATYLSRNTTSGMPSPDVYVVRPSTM